MITRFIEGNYYRFINEKDGRDICTNFNPDGKMDLVLDGKWHRCIEVDSNDTTAALFENMMSRSGGNLWYWALSDFEQKPPVLEMIVCLEEKI
jgi:hypothetical protein